MPASDRVGSPGVRMRRVPSGGNAAEGGRTPLMSLLWTFLMNGPLGLGAYWVARHGFRQPPGLSRFLAAVVLAWAWITLGMEVLGSLGWLSRGPLALLSLSGMLLGLAIRVMDRRGANPASAVPGGRPVDGRGRRRPRADPLGVGVPGDPLLAGGRSRSSAMGRSTTSISRRDGGRRAGSSSSPPPSARTPRRISRRSATSGSPGCSRRGGAIAWPRSARPRSSSSVPSPPTDWRAAWVRVVPRRSSPRHGSSRRRHSSSSPSSRTSTRSSWPAISWPPISSSSTPWTTAGRGRSPSGPWPREEPWGRKATGIVFVPILLVLALLAVLRRPGLGSRTVLHVALLLTLPAVMAGYWYGRNALLTGNPLYPLHLEALGTDLARGLVRLRRDAPEPVLPASGSLASLDRHPARRPRPPPGPRLGRLRGGRHGPSGGLATPLAAGSGRARCWPS